MLCVFFFHLRVPNDEYARHRRGEGGAFPSLFTQVNLKYHRRAFIAIFELYFLQKELLAPLQFIYTNYHKGHL